MMYALDLSKVNALEIIERSMTCHPSLLIEALNNEGARDTAYAADKTGKIRASVMFRAELCGLSRDILSIAPSRAIEFFRNNMGAGIIALNIACKLQCIPPHVRTAAALRTWET